MPLPDGTPTAKEIAQHYYACLDSVALIKKLKMKSGLDEEEQDTLERNKAHLRHMLRQDFWTNEDLAPIAAEADEQAQTPPKVSADRLKRILDRHLDDFAQTGGFDSLVEGVTWVLSSRAAWKAKAQYLVALRDDTYQVARVILRDVQNGTREPMTRDEFLALLPVPAWP
jgi:hypothetical protein